MDIIDSQVHLWGGGKANPPHRQLATFSAEDLIKEMDGAGVAGAVIHPPGWDEKAQDVAIDAARRYPKRFAVLGRFDVSKPENRALVEGWKTQPGMLGLRFTFLLPHQKNWMTDGTMDWVWPAAERAGLPVGLAAANYMPEVARIAERHPGLRLLVDHLGAVSGKKDAEAFANAGALAALGKFPNVAVKASAAPGTSSEAYPYRNVHAFLRQIYDGFGPRRFFWGTDLTRMPCSYRECVTMFTEELPFLTAADKELVMGQALCDWIGWRRS